MEAKKIAILDSTLRDGAQAEGISFSVSDKIKIVKALDELGVTYIEAGNPGSNPKDMEFFAQAANMQLTQAKLCAFGSTCRVGTPPQEDANIRSLLDAGTPAVSVFGKTWDLHVADILKTTLEKNLEIISDTIAYLKENGKEVIFDAEHFFDGYRANRAYALACVDAAQKAGADCIVLCDTNGATFPNEIGQITGEVAERLHTAVGIHCHNDVGVAVANSMVAVPGRGRACAGDDERYRRAVRQRQPLHDSSEFGAEAWIFLLKAGQIRRNHRHGALHQRDCEHLPR